MINNLQSAFQIAFGFYPELRDRKISVDMLKMTMTKRRVVFGRIHTLTDVRGEQKWVIFFNSRVLAHNPPVEVLIEVFAHELEHILRGDIGPDSSVPRPHAGKRIDRSVDAKLPSEIVQKARQWRETFLNSL
ncbi:MAG: hypothetical protein QMC78_02150 [Methanocellales archaeon]|nr:hypothetical protein [Methanocellales archaeon]